MRFIYLFCTICVSVMMSITVWAQNQRWEDDEYGVTRQQQSSELQEIEVVTYKMMVKGYRVVNQNSLFASSGREEQGIFGGHAFDFHGNRIGLNGECIVRIPRALWNCENAGEHFATPMTDNDQILDPEGEISATWSQFSYSPSKPRAKSVQCSRVFQENQASGRPARQPGGEPLPGAEIAGNGFGSGLGVFNIAPKTVIFLEKKCTILRGD